MSSVFQEKITEFYNFFLTLSKQYDIILKKGVKNVNYDFDEMIDRIKAKKKEAGLTNKQLSELSGVPYGTLNKILGSETREPSINAIIKISLALGVSANYIINGEDKTASQTIQEERDSYKEIFADLTPEEKIELKRYSSYLRSIREKKQE